MVVVSNAGPLIALARIGQLQLLPSLFGNVHLPTAVHVEVVDQGAERPGSEDVARAEWVHTGEVRDRVGVDLLRDRLGKGESEAVVLAIEMNADLLSSSMRNADGAWRRHGTSM